MNDDDFIQFRLDESKHKRLWMYYVFIQKRGSCPVKENLQNSIQNLTFDNEGEGSSEDARYLNRASGLSTKLVSTMDPVAENCRAVNQSLYVCSSSFDIWGGDSSKGFIFG